MTVFRNHYILSDIFDLTLTILVPYRLPLIVVVFFLGRLCLWFASLVLVEELFPLLCPYSITTEIIASL